MRITNVFMILVKKLFKDMLQDKALLGGAPISPVSSQVSDSELKPPKSPVAKKPRLSKDTGKTNKSFKAECEKAEESKIEPELDEEGLGEPDFYFEKGFRKVKPYFFTYKTFAKGRWVGRSLLEVFNKEFHSRSTMFFENAIKAGRLTVNGNQIDIDYKIKDLDVIRNRAHRHELPVLDKTIEVIADTDSILAVNKPCSIPVHTCGRYHYNTISFLLMHDHGYKNLRISFRLDRTTSGLLLFTKDLKTDQKIKKLISERKIKKEYICKVDGVFPGHEVVCEEPMDKLVEKMGIIHVTKAGKPCLTKFKRIWTDGNCSVLRCYPETGRTHQIRVHLQFLGHPIVNDVLYNNFSFGPSKGKNADYGKSLEQLIKDVSEAHSATQWILDNPDLATGKEGPEVSEGICDGDLSNDTVVEADNGSFDALCPECKVKTKDPSMEHMNMYLHCLRYQCVDWTFETPLPEWAKNSDDAVHLGEKKFL